jgi:hypothetical protein
MLPLDKNVQDCTMLQFGDDIIICHSDNDLRNISKMLSKEVGKMNAFLEESRLEMAPDKFCLFSENKKIRSTSWEITMNDILYRSVTCPHRNNIQ